MSPFVRFLLLLLTVGIIVNFTIVVIANHNSQTRQRDAAAQERKDFKTLIDGVNGRPRRADIAVEWQKTDALGQVLQTSLLVRCYYLTESSQPTPLPLKRVRIDGNRVYIDGLTLDFDVLFSQNDAEFQLLRNTKFSYFAHVYGEDEPAQDRFNFLQINQPPELTRIHPDKPMPGFFEMHLWRQLWEYIQAPPDQTHPGVKVTWLKPAAIAVQNGQTYSAYLDNGGITLERDNTPGLLTSMLNEAEKMTDPLPIP